MGDTYADLLREIGLESPTMRAAREGVPPPMYEPPQPNSEAARAYNRRRHAQAARDDFAQQAPNQAYVPSGNQFAELPQIVAESTGVPSLYRGYQMYTDGVGGVENDQAANEQLLWGGVGALGTLSMLPASRGGSVRPPMRAEPFPDFGVPPDAVPALRPPPREIASNGMPIAQSEPFRNSLRGGSEDLADAARMRNDAGNSTARNVSELPDGGATGALEGDVILPSRELVAPQQGSRELALPSGVQLEGRNRGATGLARYRYTPEGASRADQWDFVVEPDAADPGMFTVRMERRYNGELVPHDQATGDLSAGEAMRIYSALQETLLADATTYRRQGYYITGLTRQLRELHEQMAARADQRGMLPPGYRFEAGSRRQSARIVRDAQTLPAPNGLNGGDATPPRPPPGGTDSPPRRGPQGPFILPPWSPQ